MSDIHGKVALITGASSGIGAALAEEFARRGADVVLVARREGRLEAVADAVRAKGRRAVAVTGDVTRDGDLERVVAAGLEELGRIDFVVANAGFGVSGPHQKLTLEDFRRQFETNVYGVLRTLYASRDALLASRGCLAIIGSVAGCVPLAGSAPYSMSKAAVHSLAGCIRYELAPKGVGVTLVVPGFVDSQIRQVNNRGELRPHASDPVPVWLRMRVSVAARKIVGAMIRRRPVRVLTFHGRVVVFIQRHAPWLVRAIVRTFGVRDSHQGR